MPAKSDKQRKMMAIAEHEPSKLFGRNKGVLNMSKSQLHDFASTKNAAKKKKAAIAGNSSTGHGYDFRLQTGRKAPKRMSTVK